MDQNNLNNQANTNNGVMPAMNFNTAQFNNADMGGQEVNTNSNLVQSNDVQQPIVNNSQPLPNTAPVNNQVVNQNLNNNVNIPQNTLSNPVNNMAQTPGVVPPVSQDVNIGMSAPQNTLGNVVSNITPNAIPVQPQPNNASLNSNVSGNSDSSTEKKNKNLPIILAVGAVLIAAALILKFTGVLGGSEDNNTNDDVVVQKLTDAEMKDIIKNLYENTTVRYVFNEYISYCGSYDEDSKTTIDDIEYVKSNDYKTLADVDNYLNQFFTENLLSEQGHNSENAYLEQDDELYCNTFKYEEDPAKKYFVSDKTSYEIVESTEDSFTAKIYAVYSSEEDFDNEENLTNVEIQVGVIKNSDNWILDTYEELLPQNDENVDEE